MNRTQCVYQWKVEEEVFRCQTNTRSQGLCHAHYQRKCALVASGKASMEDLKARGMIGVGGSPVANSTSFLLGSKVQGAG